MTRSVELPLWLLILVLLFAAVTFASHFLFPSVRWFFRKRMERVVAKLNQKLVRPIEPFKLARRYDMIQRLIYDPEVAEAIVEHAQSENVPENVAFESARRYAREIVPSFSATLYFSVGTRIARWISNGFYRVRLGSFDRENLSKISPDATVIFVMNHRSNMDYVLVTHLASRAGALSYAVGEWARIWPLSALIRMMGAYFIRRRSRGQLYRRVLARYVQLATQNGVTQAIFPEGRLSLTGRVAEPKLGLLSYIVSDFHPEKRAVIFVPVALNYDQIIEDKVLIAAGKAGTRRFGMPLRKIIGASLAHLWQRATFRFKKFGTASVSFGAPLSLGDFIAGKDGDIAQMVADELSHRVESVMPVLPVPLISTILLRAEGPVTRGYLIEEVRRCLDDLATVKASRPERGAETLVQDGLATMLRRDLVRETDAGLSVADGSEDVLGFYAASIAHYFDALAAIELEIAATAE